MNTHKYRALTLPRVPLWLGPLRLCSQRSNLASRSCSQVRVYVPLGQSYCSWEARPVVNLNGNPAPTLLMMRHRHILIISDHHNTYACGDFSLNRRMALAVKLGDDEHD